MGRRSRRSMLSSVNKFRDRLRGFDGDLSGGVGFLP
jgi:hypothetical protein